MTSQKAEIQRYELTDRMFPRSEGYWVRYTDHLAALAAHTAEQRERVEAAVIHSGPATEQLIAWAEESAANHRDWAEWGAKNPDDPRLRINGDPEHHAMWADREQTYADRLRELTAQLTAARQQLAEVESINDQWSREWEKHAHQLGTLERERDALKQQLDEIPHNARSAAIHIDAMIDERRRLGQMWFPDDIERSIIAYMTRKPAPAEQPAALASEARPAGADNPVLPPHTPG